MRICTKARLSVLIVHKHHEMFRLHLAAAAQPTRYGRLLAETTLWFLFFFLASKNALTLFVQTFVFTANFFCYEMYIRF